MLQRNVNSRFAQNPTLENQRSRFDRNNTYKTTFNAGDLIPIYVDSDILPGDTVTMDTASVVRMSTPIYPVMDNANIDIFWFFVPHRIVWDDFEHFMTGGLDAGEWDAPTVYEPPMVRPRTFSYPSGQFEYKGYPSKTLADYMGIPCGFSAPGDERAFNTDIAEGVSALPFRAYAKIWNDWFRSSSIQPEILIPTTSGFSWQPIFYVNDGAPVDGYKQLYSYGDHANVLVKNEGTTVYGGALLKANKYHDFFTSALIEPQRGEPVGVPLEGALPVVTTGVNTWHIPLDTPPLMFAKQDKAMSGTYEEVGFLQTVGPDNVYASPGSVSAGQENLNGYWLNPVNLVADTSVSNTLQISINDLRHAMAVQHILELDARSGSGRYIDLLKGHFGVTSPDARLQRAEYLGGASIPINITPVAQTSQTSDVSPQGNVAAYSWTSDVSSSFTKSFVEHGTLMCLAVVRHVRSYQQGLHKMWSRPTRYDHYWPSLANISEQAILNKEIFVSGDPEIDNQVFGYQEAFAEYRYKPSIVTGAMRSSYPQPLDAWHYADYYTGTPHLSSEWLQEGSEEIDRTLAVSSAVEDQFIGDFAFNSQWYRVMPMYSIPGLDRM